MKAANPGQAEGQASDLGEALGETAEIAALRNQVACLKEALEEAQGAQLLLLDAQAQARNFLAALKETKAVHETAKAEALDLLAKAYRKVAES